MNLKISKNEKNYSSKICLRVDLSLAKYRHVSHFSSDPPSSSFKGVNVVTLDNMALWRNGQRVGLRIRRLWVRVPSESLPFTLAYFFDFSLSSLHFCFELSRKGFTFFVPADMGLRQTVSLAIYFKILKSSKTSNLRCPIPAINQHKPIPVSNKFKGCYKVHISL